MKQFSISNQLTLVGKAWEIRSRLRSMMAEGQTLGEYLGNRQPANPQ